MTWVRLDDSFLEHPKFIDLELPALRVWLRALCYCNRQNTGGFVGDSVLRKLGATPRIREQLTTPPSGYVAGLWESVEGGVGIHDYAVYQPRPSPELRAKRAEYGRRGGQESGRRRASGTTSPHVESTPSQGASTAAAGGLLDDLEGTSERLRADLERTLEGVSAEPASSKQPESLDTAKQVASFCSNPVPSRPVPPSLASLEGERARAPENLETASPGGRPANAAADGVWGMSVTAWAEGIRASTGKPCMPPRGGSAELAKLVEALVFFCPDESKRIEWARDQAKAFASTNKGKLNAHSFVDWLNSPPPKQSPPARTTALQQAPANRPRAWNVGGAR